MFYSTVCSGADQRKHQSSASLAFVRGIHRSPVNSPHKGPVTRKCFHLVTSSCHIHFEMVGWQATVCGAIFGRHHNIGPTWNRPNLYRCLQVFVIRQNCSNYDEFMEGKRLPKYCTFMRGIHVEHLCGFPHKGAVMF